MDFAHFNVLDAKSIIFCVLALFFVRPLAIVLSTFRTEMNFKERLLLGWIAPRGVVAATMAGLVAPKMIEVGYEGAEYILAFIFLIVFITVLVHGVSLPILARFMGLASKSKSGMLIVGSNPVTTDLARVLMGEGVQILLVDNSWTRLSQARLSGVNVHYGEILSEDSEDELDLSEMGVLLAGTDNDCLLYTSPSPRDNR